MKQSTPLYFLTQYCDNNIYIKRDDLIPYSFGGNKARKGFLFFEEIDRNSYDCVVTYGSSHSNHCRIISNMAAARGMQCYIIAPEETSDLTYNSRFMKLFDAKIITVPVRKVHETIEDTIDALKKEGKKPYFIPGGGHSNIGTQAYVNCYEEIKKYEIQEEIYFDYIFFASGTGTTHSGLICGQIKYGDDRKVIGISIARKNPYGRNVVVNSVREYFADVSDDKLQKNTIFIDDYICGGYGQGCIEIELTIKEFMTKYGIPLDSTYTGKAFWGMKKYIEQKKVNGKNILFIHTGGTPLFFDMINDFK